MLVIELIISTEIKSYNAARISNRLTQKPPHQQPHYQQEKPHNQQEKPHDQKNIDTTTSNRKMPVSSSISKQHGNSNSEYDKNNNNNNNNNNTMDDLESTPMLSNKNNINYYLK